MLMRSQLHRRAQRLLPAGIETVALLSAAPPHQWECSPLSALPLPAAGRRGWIGMALHEESMMDHKLGRFMNHNLGEYHVPVNADIGAIDIVIVDEEDKQINELGAKGVGEIGITGVAAAIANAVYHATGKRIRDLPITPDKVLV